MKLIKVDPPPIVRHSFMEEYFKVIQVLTLLFPVWLIILTIWVFVRPNFFTWLTTEVVTLAQIGDFRLEIDPYSLSQGIVMFAMGLTVDFQDFKGWLTHKEKFTPILLALSIQFIVTPLIAYVISFFMAPGTGTGLLLLSSVPGSQMSNVMTFIAGGNVPLSILMSFVSTLLSTILTPLIFNVLTHASHDLAMDDVGMIYSMVKVVLLPILTGMYVNAVAPNLTKYVKPITPVLSVFLTSCLCAAPVAGIRAHIAYGGMQVAIPVILLISLSFMSGYYLPKNVFNMGEVTTKTVAIEAGMQSAALGYLCAAKNFGDESVAVPSAVAIVVMSWLGAFYSAHCRYKMGFADLLPATWLQ